MLDKLPHEKKAERVESVLFILLGILFLILILFSRPGGSNTPDAGLWLARSCVGEAGFTSGTSGECAAIAHVYRKRVEKGSFSFYEIIRKYSSATKRRKGHPRKWIFGLNRAYTKPEKWPSTMKWEKFRAGWIDVLQMSDRFMVGKVPDPVPEADHYGSLVDAHRAERAGWRELKTPFKNKFYSMR